MKNAMRMASDDERAISDEIRQMARDSRLTVLKDAERREFFEGMTRDEFNTLREIAGAMGPKGHAKLESLIQEAVGMVE